MASLMVTTILILVISLIVVGFSQVARRNQRDALDRQLSSQAFYAAESGINQAITVIQKRVAAAQAIPAKTSCAPDSNYPGTQLASSDVSVTCLLVEPEVKTMNFDGVTESAATLVSTIPNSGTIPGVTLTWRPSEPRTSATTGCPSAGGSPSYQLPTRGGWQCGFGILRVDMSPVSTGNVGQQAKTVFLYPHAQAGAVSGTTTVVDATTMTQSLVQTRCSDAGRDPKCMVTINYPANTTEYYLNVRSLYRNSRLDITPTDGSVTFKGPVKIDVTAKAVDVLKRVRVQVSTDEQTGSLHNYGIETSQPLCKRYAVAPGYYTDADSYGLCN